jgi:predicted dehydrogenase
VEGLAASGVDAVYVASPIVAHFEQVGVALRLGKHVLCEKTLATSPGQVRELFALADAAGRVLVEEVRPNFDPALDVVRAALPRLGRLRHAHFEKCQYSSRYPAFLRGEVLGALDPASGSSALRDIGVYCLHPALALFGAPAKVHSSSYRLSNGFNAGGTALLRYDDGFSATCVYSKVTRTVTPSVIEGEAGTLAIDSIAEPAEIVLTTVDGRTETIHSGPPKLAQDTLIHAVAEFMRLSAGQEPDRFREQSLLAERVISEILNDDNA